jgi:hypothetical protein
MRPPKQSSGDFEYERIPIYDDWVNGIIEDVTLKENHAFKGKFAKVGDAIRFKFKIDGCEYPHYSGWMSYNLGKKSDIFKKYLVGLVEGAQPDMAFDLDRLKGLKVKMIWKANGDFDNLELIRPLGKKILPSGKVEDLTADEVADKQAEEGMPF